MTPTQMPKIRDVLEPSEDLEQQRVFQWAAIMSREHPCLKSMFAIPNGGFRHKATGVHMKKTGTKAGVPDIFLPAARFGHHGLFIEMKRRKGGKLSPNQEEWIDMLKGQGYKVVVAHGYEEAVTAIMTYLNGYDCRDR